MWSSREPRPAHRARSRVIGTAIVLPLVIFVLGPNMPPGKGTRGREEPGHRQHRAARRDDAVHRVHPRLPRLRALPPSGRAKGERSARRAPIRGHMPSQLAWLATTTVAVLFLAIFGTTELLADNGAGGGSGPDPVAKPSGAVLPVQVIGAAVGVHVPLPDLRRRRDGARSCCRRAARSRSTSPRSTRSTRSGRTSSA